MLTLADRKLMQQNTQAMWSAMEQHREIATALFGDPLHSHVEVLQEINRLKALETKENSMPKLTQEQLVTQTLDLIHSNSSSNGEALANLVALTNTYIITKVMTDEKIPTQDKATLTLMAAQFYSAMLVDGFEQAIAHVEGMTGFKAQNLNVG